jgi:pimeloyl-ACP methyl ester carboxylesterase
MNVEIDGCNVHYRVTGEGNNVAVILQGWGTSLKLYDLVADTINDQYRVSQVDFPGFGESDEPEEAWNVDAYGDFVCAFLKELGVERAVLIGHSYGGRVIIKLANRQDNPFEIEKIVLIDSAGVKPELTFVQKFKVKKYKVLQKFLNLKVVYFLFPELIDDWRSRQGSADYRNATPMMRQCMVLAINEDLTDLLPGIKQETLLVWGDLDTATPIGDARLMEKMIPNAGLAVLEGAGHFSFLEKPAIFRSIMRTFLELENNHVD